MHVIHKHRVGEGILKSWRDKMYVLVKALCKFDDEYGNFKMHNNIIMFDDV